MKMTFEEWMSLIDRLSQVRYGFDTNNFSDWNWMDAYDSGMEPAEAFREWVEDDLYGPEVLI